MYLVRERLWSWLNTENVKSDLMHEAQHTLLKEYSIDCTPIT